MAKGALTGSRIRSRRLDRGLRQSDLARGVGISPAYLNLIEHNRRRIGGKLLNDLARALGTEAALLSEGAESALLAALRDAASAQQESEAELSRTEEFAGRFPGWSRLVAVQAERISQLERVVETLTDRLTHDPFLSASMHELLSTVTAIRSTASILAEPGEIDAEWQARFHRNLHEEAVRLAEGAGALVTYLDGAGDAETALSSPQDELDALLAARGYHFAELEGPSPGTPAQLVAGLTSLQSAPARTLAGQWLTRYGEDAAELPLAEFAAAAEAEAYDPLRLAARFGADMARIMRRLASLPASPDQPEAGLVICDGAGAFTFRKPCTGFSPPRYGAACPYWPLYEALARPQVPIRHVIELAGRQPQKLLAYAICQPVGPPGFDLPQVHEATMLVLPVPAGVDDGSPVPVGTVCRLCPRSDCAARRESSILSEGI